MLPADGVLRFNKRFREISQDCDLSNVTHPENFELEMEARMLKGRACTSTSIVVSNEIWTHQETEKGHQDKMNNTDSMCTCVDNCYCWPECADEETVIEPRPEVYDSEVSETSTDFNTYIHVTGHNCQFSSASVFRQKLLHFIQTINFDKVSGPFVRRLLLAFDYLNYLVNSLETDSVESFMNVPFRLMEDFLLLVNMVDDQHDVFRNMFGMSRERFILLQLISEWLGKEFHDLEGLIKENVEIFKKDNIMCIDSLPSPETIIKTLFPSFMTTFVINWLGFQNEDDTLHNKSEATSDHCYTQVTKLKGQANINYQLVQLILEFGSNCLISGIGHVVFSRLQLENNSDV